MSSEPVILRCPNCGAPLELIAGACRWCGEPVTMRAAPTPTGRDADDREDGADGDDDADDADDDDPVVRAVAIHDRIDLGDSDSKALPPIAWILSTLSWVTYDPQIQAFLDAHPDLLALARPLVAALQTAGERIHATGLAVEELMHDGFAQRYSPNEMWTFDLGADVLVWLVGLDAVDQDMRASVTRELQRSFWTDGFKRPLAKAADGPAALRPLRAAVPHR